MDDERVDPLADLLKTTLIKCLENEAAITALKRFISRTSLAQTDAERDQILRQIESLEKQAYSEILLKIEDINPSVAAFLDSRRVRDTPEAQ